MAFKDSFKKFRIRQRLTKVDIAKYIHKTDAYVRKIENEGYLPPKYSICKMLADIFVLTKEEKVNFYEEALIERLKDDYVLYEEVINGRISESTKIDLPISHSYKGDKYITKCTYLISWRTREKIKILTKPKEQKCRTLLTEIIKGFGHTLQYLYISINEVKLIMDMSPNTNIYEHVEGFKAVTSRRLRNHYDDLSYLPSVWDHSCEIYTIGNPKEIDYLCEEEPKTTII